MSANVSQAMTVPVPPKVPDVIAELHRLHREATEDSISGDLEGAKNLVQRVPEPERAEAERLYLSLCQLERWLHDR